MSVRYVHTNIICRDWKALVVFYVEVFECSIRPPERHLSGDWLNKGTGVSDARIEGVHLALPGFGSDGPTLEIFQYDKSFTKADPLAANREGFSHIAFHVDDVEATLMKMISRGGSQLGEVVNKEFPSGNLVFVYAADPEGNIVELQNWKIDS